MNKTPEWLRELMDEFAHSTERKSDRSLQRFAAAFSGYDPDVMSAAVDAFLLNDPRPVQAQGFFPAIAHLRPFVDAAVENARSVTLATMTPAERHEIRMAHVRARIKYDDDELFEFEERHGWKDEYTADELAELEREHERIHGATDG